MQSRRGQRDPRLLCSGPGRLCQALGVTIAQNGLALAGPPFSLMPAAEAANVIVGPRIGISKAVGTAVAFCEGGITFFDRPMPAGRIAAASVP